jgi:hypothetical protein
VDQTQSSGEPERVRSRLRDGLHVRRWRRLEGPYCVHGGALMGGCDAGRGTVERV